MATPTPPVALENAANGVSWGPETPNFNLEVILRGQGFGHVKFRQPNDEQNVVHLDVWVRDLAPNTSYLLQRAVDTTIDDNWSSSAWLTGDRRDHVGGCARERLLSVHGQPVDLATIKEGQSRSN